MFDDRYDSDPIAAMRPRRGPVQRQQVVLARGLVIEHSESEWCGAVVGAREGLVQLEDGRGKVRSFPIGDGFLIDGRPVALVMPKRAPQRKITASGSIAAPQQRARVAMPSRIFVEGRHDAELVEQVWGDDLRVEGVVVEPLHGADDLVGALREFGPGPGRKVGVLLDHLVPGSKESRIADEARRAFAPYVIVLGHPYVDVWQAVRPQALGIDAWPVVPKGRPWKEGVLAALGRPHATQADVADGWRWILGHVRSYADLEPSLLGRVEQLIDEVTALD
ncbi:MAG: DUF3097 domain-containing protein [Actinobacteria bacterium]|nr:DUF3097 domain-containing protein [Actinomycetota bacterium]